jgi:SPASM domain peptide maturase of grasp-with-spasm system
VIKFNGKKISEIFKYYGYENKNHIVEYLSFLFENKIAFTRKKNNANMFAPLNLDFETASVISNALVEINTKTNYLKLFNELENLGCNHILLVSFPKLSIMQIEEIIKLCDSSVFKSIEIITSFFQDFTLFESLFGKYPRLKSVILHSTPEKYHLEDNIMGAENITFLTETYTKFADLSKISINNFRVNLPLYTESLKFNAFFNKKIIIDSKGNVLKSMYNSESYGNIYKTKIIDIYNNTDLKEYWEISKNNILICQDCEYKYMCIDSRVPLKGENYFYFNDTCHYNPYIAKWKGEQDWVSVDEWNIQNGKD